MVGLIVLSKTKFEIFVVSILFSFFKGRANTPWAPPGTLLYEVFIYTAIKPSSVSYLCVTSRSERLDLLELHHRRRVVGLCYGPRPNPAG